MKVYMDNNVLEESLNRLRHIYSSEDNVFVSSSGGKDSTVITELAIIVAREQNKLPVKVAFLDQESEYQSTVAYFQKIKHRPEIQLYWFQIPFILGSNLSKDFVWLHCWNPDEEDKWMRPHEEGAITTMGELQESNEMRFYRCCDLLGEYIFGKDAHYISLTGMRASESLTRRGLMMRTTRVYKGLSYASRVKTSKNGYKLYPIYDWETSDVWKFIYDIKAPYNAAYDRMFQAGKSINDMRVSSFIHENGISGLKTLQAIEPKTFDRLVSRIGGLSAYKHLHTSDYMYSPRKLPDAFASWNEYRDFLLEHLCNPESQAIFRKAFKDDWDTDNVKLLKGQIVTILKNDICLTSYTNYKRSARV